MVLQVVARMTTTQTTTEMADVKVGTVVQISKCEDQEFYKTPGKVTSVKETTVTVLFSNDLLLEVPKTWVSILPSMCGEYKGVVHTRDHVRQLAPELSSEEAGKLLSLFVVHFYTLPRHVFRIPAVHWIYAELDGLGQTARPEVVLVEPRGHRPAHTFFVVSRPYANVYDSLTGCAVHTDVELNSTKLLKQMILNNVAEKPKFPLLSRFEQGGSLPMRNATYSSLIRAVSDRYYGIENKVSYKEVSNFWMKLLELPSKATLLSMVCGGSKTNKHGNLVPVNQLWEVVTVNSKDFVGFKWMFQDVADINDRKRKRKAVIEKLGNRVKALPKTCRQVLRGDVSLIGHPVIRKLIDPKNYKCILHKGFIFINPDLIGYHADGTNGLGVAQMLNEILDAKARNPRLVEAFVSVKPDSKSISEKPSKNKYSYSEVDATTSYLQSVHKASSYKKKKQDISAEVGSIRLEHAPPCVRACLDKDRPFKNTTRYQLASVVASVLPTASVTDQQKLMMALEAVVCHPENPNKHRWKEFVSDLTCQQKKFNQLTRLPCVRRQGKLGQRVPPDVLVSQNIDPGLMCPFNCSTNPVGSCLKTRSIPEKLQNKNPEEWRVDEIWYLTTPITET